MGKRKNSIRKGKRFEALVAKILTDKLGCSFHRVPQSGATATTKDLQTLRGDIFTEAPEYKHLIIECKFRSQAFTIQELVEEARPYNLNGYLEQTWEEAGCDEELGQRTNWLLFAKSNQKRILVFTNDLPLLRKLVPQKDILAVRNSDTSFFVGVL